jgi:hypothetical protein
VGGKPCLNYFDGTYWAGGLISSTTIPLGTWAHVAGVFDGATAKIYINGTQTGTWTTTWTTSSQVNYLIGRRWDTGGSNYFSGYISNFRLVIGTAVYTSNFTPSTTPLTAITNTVLLTLQDNRFKDNSTNAFALTVNGTPRIQPMSPFAVTTTYSAAVNGGSMYFNGSTDYLTTPASTGDLSTGDFTIEYWAWNDSTQPATNYSSQVGTLADATPAKSWRFGTFAPSGNLIFAYHNGSNYVDVTFGSVAYNDSVWRHFAITRYNGVLRAFVNGIQVGTNQTVTQNFNSSNRVIVGAELVTPSYFTGYMDDLRITKGIARYTSNFTPPTTAFLTL